MRIGIVLLCLLVIVGCSKKDTDEESSGASDVAEESPATSSDTVHLLMVEGTALEGNPMFKEGTVQMIAVAVHDRDADAARQLAMERIEPMGYGDLELKSQEEVDLAGLSPDDPRMELCAAARDSGFSMAVIDLQEEDRRPSDEGQ
jgi:hypothetical protein